MFYCKASPNISLWLKIRLKETHCAGVTSQLVPSPMNYKGTYADYLRASLQMGRPDTSLVLAHLAI